MSKIQLCTIEPIMKADMPLAYTFYNKPTGTNFTMLTSGEIVETKVDEDVPVNRKSHNFGKHQRRVTFQWDAEDEEHIGSRERTFLLQHASVICDTFGGNLNLATPRFKLIDHYTEDIKDYERLLSVTSMTNKVLAMGASDLADILYYFGINASGMSVRKMLLKLLSPQGVAIVGDKAMLAGGGILLEYTEQYDRAQEFHALFTAQTEDTRRVINIKKAINVGIIAVDGNVYKANEEVLGDSIDLVLSYYKNNPDRYDNYIRQQVEAKINETHLNDLDIQPEKELVQSFKPIKATAATPKVDRYTEADLKRVEDQIRANDNNAELKSNIQNYHLKQTTLKMEKGRIQKYLKEQAQLKHEKEHGTYSATQTLKKQGEKNIKKVTQTQS